MKVLYIATECKPFSKVGGMGDVANELPLELKAQGVDVEIVTPFYECIQPIQTQDPRQYTVEFHGRKEPVNHSTTMLENVPVNFLENKRYFGGAYGKPYIYSDPVPFSDDALRFSFFSEACLQLIRDKKPDVVHINDWCNGYLFGRMVQEQLPQARVLTVHGAGSQGNIGVGNVHGWNMELLLADQVIGEYFRDPRKEWNSVNALRLGLELAHGVNTVSPTYARELTQPADLQNHFRGGDGLHEVCSRLYEQGRLVGILNGIAYAGEPTDEAFAKKVEEKRQAKERLCERFTDRNAMLIGFAGRAAEQKFGLLTIELGGKSLLEMLIAMPGVNVVVQASGQKEYESFITDISKRPMWYVKALNMPKRQNYAVSLDPADAAQIFLASDVFLMPSTYEPCGITQLLAMRDAAVPIVRRTGGLVDTVKDFPRLDCTGFCFNGTSEIDIFYSLMGSVNLARQMFGKDDFRAMQRRAFSERFPWSTAATRYITELYEPALKRRETWRPGRS